MVGRRLTQAEAKRLLDQRPTYEECIGAKKHLVLGLSSLSHWLGLREGLMDVCAALRNDNANLVRNLGHCSFTLH